MAEREQAVFHYPLPEEASSVSSWSGLSQAARSALVGAIAGPSAAERLLPEAERASSPSTPEVGDWAERELGEALQNWRKYKNHLIALPDSIDQLKDGHPHYAETVARLFEARQALIRSGEKTPDGENIGESMHLVLVPWEDMLRSRSRFGTWVMRMRDTQGAADSDDYIRQNLLEVINSDAALYRNPATPEQLMSSSEYLERSISVDGLWGIMLAQTSQAAGLDSKLGKSPDDLTGNGRIHFSVEGHAVDRMGVFEWISLTLQQDPSKLSSADWSWLLANRAEVGRGGPRVACGFWRGGRVRSSFGRSDHRSGGMRPRLAVM